MLDTPQASYVYRIFFSSFFLPLSCTSVIIYKKNGRILMCIDSKNVYNQLFPRVGVHVIIFFLLLFIVYLMALSS